MAFPFLIQVKELRSVSSFEDDSESPSKVPDPVENDYPFEADNGFQCSSSSGS